MSLLRILRWGMVAGNIGAFLYFLLFDLYPLPLVFLNVFSIILLWGSVVLSILKKQKRKDILIESCIVLSLFVISFAIRVYKIDVVTPGMWGDEVGYGRIAERVWDLGKYVPFTDDAFAPPSPFFYLIRASLFYFGRSFIALRFPSIIFGALGVAAFYLLLRNQLNRLVSICGSILFSFSYSYIIISRFAYEMTAGLFFFILSILFLYRYFKHRQLSDAVGTALSVGGALYMYVAFRLTAVGILAILAVLILSSTSAIKRKLTIGLIGILVFLISIVSLVSYTIRHPSYVFARVRAVSVFNQGFSSDRLVKELQGNAIHSFGLFTIYTDPNPNHNPVHAPMFDRGAEALLFLGLLYLLKKKQYFLFFLLLFLSIPSFVNDIFTVELFPEYHDYGTGHPMMTRLCGLFPLVYIGVAWGISGMQTLINKIKKQYSLSLNFIATEGVVAVTLGLSFYNAYLYFAQPPNKWIDSANNLPVQQVVSYLNAVKPKTVTVSETFTKDQRFQYFLKPDITVHPLLVASDSADTALIPIGELTILDVLQSEPLARKIAGLGQQNDPAFTVSAFFTAWKEVASLVVVRNK
jgi:hypothetical protein